MNQVELGADAEFSHSDDQKNISSNAQASTPTSEMIQGALKKYFATANDDASVPIFVRKSITGSLFLLWHQLEK